MKALKKSMSKYWQMYLLLIPVIIYYVVFKYMPMVGAQIAFKNFSFRKGIWGSAWVGMAHFERFFSSSQAISIIWNTLYLGFLTIIFCFPMPIILALILAMSVFNDPNSSLAFWGSVIPLTSPVVMMARIPFGIPTWQIVLSLILLYISVVGMAWAAGKIYRVGIFMHGKKPSYKELWQWLKQ